MSKIIADNLSTCFMPNIMLRCKLYGMSHGCVCLLLRLAVMKYDVDACIT